MYSNKDRNIKDDDKEIHKKYDQKKTETYKVYYCPLMAFARSLIPKSSIAYVITDAISFN